jgi:hypothetical protein
MRGYLYGGKNSYWRGIYIGGDILIFLKSYNYYPLIQIEEVWRELKNEKTVLLKVKSLKD